MNESQEKMTVADRSTEFIPVEGGGESTSAAGLLVTAYAIMWLFVFGFIWLTSGRLRNLQTRVADLEGALKKAEGTSPIL